MTPGKRPHNSPPTSLYLSDVPDPYVDTLFTTACFVIDMLRRTAQQGANSGAAGDSLITRCGLSDMLNSANLFGDFDNAKENFLRTLNGVLDR